MSRKALFVLLLLLIPGIARAIPIIPTNPARLYCDVEVKVEPYLFESGVGRDAFWILTTTVYQVRFGVDENGERTIDRVRELARQPDVGVKQTTFVGTERREGNFILPASADPPGRMTFDRSQFGVLYLELTARDARCYNHATSALVILGGEADSSQRLIAPTQPVGITVDPVPRVIVPPFE